MIRQPSRVLDSRRTTIASIAAIAAAILLVPFAFCVQPSARKITAHVTLSDERSHPVSGIAVMVASGRENAGASSGITNELGEVDLQIEVSTGARLLYVAAMPSVGGVSAFNARSAIQAYQDKLETRSLKIPVILPLVEGQDGYVVGLHAKAAIAATGRLVNASGAPAGGSISVRGTYAPLSVGKDGQFKLTNVPKGEACELMVTNAEGSRIVSLTASQTAADVNLGDVSLPVAPSDVRTVVVQVSRADLVRHSYESSANVLMFVKEDCSVIRKCRLFPVAEKQGQMQGQVDLPSGKYFVGVGVPSSPYIWALTTLLRSQKGPRQATDSEIPSVQVSDKATTDVQIDMLSFDAAFRSLQSFW